MFLFQELLLAIIIQAVITPLSFLGGMIYENTHDVLRGGKKDELLRNNARIALECIDEAEDKHDTDIEKFEHAVDEFVKRTGKSLAEAQPYVQMMFNVSTYRH